VAAGAEPGPKPSRALPAQGLVACLEYDGLDAHAAAWKATAAWSILHETPAGAMTSELVKQLLDFELKSSPEFKVSSADLLDFPRDLVRQGLAIAAYDHGAGSEAVVIVLRGMGRKEPRERFDRFLRGMLGGEAPGGGKAPAPVRLRGREVHQVAEAAPPQPADADRPPALAAPRKPAAPPEPSFSWWVEGDDLILVAGPTPAAGPEPAAKKPKAKAPTHTDQVGAVLDAIEGKQPNASTHAGYLAALAEGKDIAGFEPDGLFFIEVGRESDLLEKLQGLLTGLGPICGAELPMRARRIEEMVPLAVATPPPASPLDAPAPPPPATPAPPPSSAIAPPATPAPVPVLEQSAVPPAPDQPKAGADAKVIDELEVLGLKGVTRILGCWGFAGKGLVTDIRLETRGPHKGLIGLLDQPAFRKDRLPPIPRGTSAYVVASFDPGRSYDRVIGLLKTLEPAARAEFDQLEKAVRDAVGSDLHRDLLAHLGPTWCAYPSPDAGRDRDEKYNTVMVVGTDDAEAFGKSLDVLASRVNESLRKLEGDDGRKEGDPPILALERLPAPARGYQLTSPARLVPWLNGRLRPTVLIGKSYIAFAPNPAQARAALAAEWEPGVGEMPEGELARTFACLPTGLTSLSVTDPRESILPDLVSTLPAYVQMLSNHLGLAVDAEAGPASGVRTILGLPSPGGFRVRLDPAKLPTADALRARLFPGVLASAVDDRGLRWIGREAFPLSGVPGADSLDVSTTFNFNKPAEGKLKLGFDLLRLLGTP
jgi:hypothetical protein